MKSFKNLQFLACFLFLCVCMQAQVTLGYLSEPRSGALLDLTTEADGTASKGLGLPRVSLLKVKPSVAGHVASTIEGVTEYWDPMEHIGLMVYNVKESLCASPGVHVWNGSEWNPLMPSILHEAIFQLNSYLVEANDVSSIIQIPIAKAFDIWDFYGSGAGNYRLPKRTISTNLTAKIVWQEKNGGINTVSNVSLNKATPEGRISVSVAGKKGNAVIGLYDGNDIVWSWHIWVTDNPTTQDLNANGYRWMDRSLGATSNIPGDAGTIGLYFQSGRKDPIPRPTGWNNTEPVVSNYEGQDIIVSKVKAQVHVDNSDAEIRKALHANLANTIYNPLTFYWQDVDVSSTPYNDWYNPTKIILGNQATIFANWVHRWSDECAAEGLREERKTPWDPCPEGWKVPAPVGYLGDNAWGAAVPYIDQSHDSGLGYNLNDLPNNIGSFGYVPKVGIRSGYSGNLEDVGVNFLHWSGYGIYGLRKKGTNISSKEQKTFGGMVRCVKEF